MKIAIIGAGFGGLAAANKLLDKNHQVTIFERNRYLGGLAAGIKQTSDKKLPWDWDLEKFYHHWFTNDDFVFRLGKEIGVSDKFITRNVTTSILFNEASYPFDSPLSLLTFPHLSITEKIKLGFTLAELKYRYNEHSSQVFEKVTAHDYLRQRLGEKTYTKIWQPLLAGKFADFYQDVNMRWFWARIYKRTPSLVYYQGGFSQFADDVGDHVRNKGGTIRLETSVTQILQKNNNQVTLKLNDENEGSFDRVIVTTPPPTLLKLIPENIDSYLQPSRQTNGIGALVVILALKHKLMPRDYWLSINDMDWPFLNLVDHSNFVSAEHYANEHLIYIGDYLPADHPHMQMEKKSLIRKFAPYLKKICPLFGPESITRSFLFKTPYAQPIFSVNHADNILPYKTPVPNVYLASMAQVYPWDRGTNYAIELGEKIARIVDEG